jgi:hypothetical protein
MAIGALGVDPAWQTSHATLNGMWLPDPWLLLFAATTSCVSAMPWNAVTVLA